MNGDATRLDAFLVASGEFPSRSQALLAITAGIVYVNGSPATKGGQVVTPRSRVEIRGQKNPYVSRGGLKLAGALDSFRIDPRGRSCLDVGSSTGGFTHCLLERGAARVVAVDVGTGQLSPVVRADSRVRVLEQTDIRDVIPCQLGGPVSLAVIDVSFISLALVLGPVRDLVEAEGEALALVKPQFEAGPGAGGKKGVVRKESQRQRALTAVSTDAGRLGWNVLGSLRSPITGKAGNVEFFIHLRAANN